MKHNTVSRNKKGSYKSNKNTKKRRLKRKQKGGSCRDYYKITGKKLCSDTHNYYIGNCFAGSNYYTYSLCEDKELTKCTSALLKIYQLNWWLNPDKINKEAAYMKRAYDLGVSPRFIAVDYCNYDGKEYGLVSVERYGEGTLKDLYENKDFFDSHKDKIVEKLREILNILYQNNIYHNDLHSKNFLYKIDDAGELEFKIIDFDRTYDLDDHPRDYKIHMLDDSDQTIELLDVQ